MNIVYFDDFVVVAVKPYGVLSASGNSDDDMISLLKKETSKEIYPVHRLDRTTGGLMVFACTTESAAELSKQISEHSFCKEYLAAAKGETEDIKGQMNDILFFDRFKNKSYTVKKERKGAKPASLEYEKLESKDTDGYKASLYRIKLYTGRTHQIRVQFASRGMPLLGDRRYGSDFKADNIALWSYKIGFINPGNKSYSEFESKPENDVFLRFNRLI